jgi:hypothetical protein
MSRLGLPYHMPYTLRDLTLQGIPLHLMVEEVRK